MAFNVKKSSVTGWRPKKRGKPFCENEFVMVCTQTKNPSQEGNIKCVLNLILLSLLLNR